jgi:large subunit ribosomal protein L28
MPRVCKFTGRKTSSGNTYTHRGKAKYLGGVGTKVTGKTKRQFKPNIQTAIAVVDGSTQRIKVSAKAIRMGLLVKPLKRKFAYQPDEAENPALSPQAAAGDQTPPAGPAGSPSED